MKNKKDSEILINNTFQELLKNLDKYKLIKLINNIKWYENTLKKPFFPIDLQSIEDIVDKK